MSGNPSEGPPLSSRANWRYTDFSLAHTARDLQMGRKAMVGVIDAAADEGDLFLDFLR